MLFFLKCIPFNVIHDNGTKSINKVVAVCSSRHCLICTIIFFFWNINEEIFDCIDGRKIQIFIKKGLEMCLRIFIYVKRQQHIFQVFQLGGDLRAVMPDIACDFLIFKLNINMKFRLLLVIHLVISQWHSKKHLRGRLSRIVHQLYLLLLRDSCETVASESSGKRTAEGREYYDFPMVMMATAETTTPTAKMVAHCYLRNWVVI